MTAPRHEPEALRDPGAAEASAGAAAGERDSLTPVREASAGRTGQIRSGKLAGRSLTAAIWILAWPVLLQQTMQACVGLVDKVLAGDLPEAIRVSALDAVGIGSYIGWFVNIAMAGLGIGGQALIARAMGGGRLGEGHHALGQAIALSAIWGLLVGIALWFLVLPLAHVTGLSPEADILCRHYVRTLAISMPLAAIMMVGGMCLHGAGETTKPSLIAVGVNVVNIIASWILSGADLTFGEWTLPNPFPFNLHVIGIAAGTAICFAVGAVLTLWVLLRGVKDLRLEPVHLPLRGSMIRRIIRIGVPNFFEGIAMWAVNLFVLIFIGMIAATAGGEGLIGAHVIAVQWEAFSFMPGFAIGTAAGALAGQYLGAGNPTMAQRAILICTGAGGVVMVLLGVVFITQAEPLTAIISPEPIHLRHTPPLLRLAGAIQIFFAVVMIVRQGLRGVGDTTWTLIITAVSSYLIRLPLCWLLGVYFELGLLGIWYGLCGEMAIRAALFLTRFFHGGWKGLEV